MARSEAPQPIDETQPVEPTSKASGTELRGRILSCATALFADRGFAGTSTREVVEAAGCTKPALYYHFGSKEGLFLECIRTQTDLFTEIVEHGTQMPGPAVVRMGEALTRFLDHVRAHPTGIRLLWRAEMSPESEQPDFDFQSVRARHNDMIRERLRQAQRSGDIRPGIDIDDATYALVGMLDQRLDLWMRGGDLPEDLPTRILDLFFYGVGS